MRHVRCTCLGKTLPYLALRLLSLKDSSVHTIYPIVLSIGLPIHILTSHISKKNQSNRIDWIFAHPDLENYPSTASGKPKKGEIARLVREHLGTALKASEEINDALTTAQLIGIWTALSGHSTDFLDPALSVGGFADSLMIMQFVHFVRKTLGKPITAKGLNTHRTISQQAKLIDPNPKISYSVTRRSRREGPPSAKNMVHTRGDTRIADQTRRAVEEIIESMSLSRDADVEDICPAYNTASETTVLESSPRVCNFIGEL